MAILPLTGTTNIWEDFIKMLQNSPLMLQSDVWGVQNPNLAGSYPDIRDKTFPSESTKTPSILAEKPTLLPNPTLDALLSLKNPFPKEQVTDNVLNKKWWL